MAFTHLKNVSMSLLEFYRVKDNPRQRDTEARMKRSTHLDTFDDTHKHVVIAYVKGESDPYKVDGHTRAAKWKTGKVKNMPANLRLQAKVYQCDSHDDLIALYERHDSPEAVERTTEAISGFQRLFNTPLKSTCARAASGHTYAYQLIRSGSSLPAYTAQNAFCALQTALADFDSITPTTTRFTTATRAAAEICILAYPDKGREFWQKHQNNEGSKLEKRCDAVQLAELMLQQFREERLQGGTQIVRQIKQYLTLFAKWIERESYSATRPPSPNDLAIESLLKRARANAAVHFDPPPTAHTKAKTA